MRAFAFLHEIERLPLHDALPPFGLLLERLAGRRRTGAPLNRPLLAALLVTHRLKVRSLWRDHPRTQSHLKAIEVLGFQTACCFGYGALEMKMQKGRLMLKKRFCVADLRVRTCSSRRIDTAPLDSIYTQP